MEADIAMNEDSEQELLDALRTTRAEYMSLTTEYDSMLFNAHSYDRGTAAMVDALHKASMLGPQLHEALRRYFEAVQQLAAFYEKRRGTSAAKSG